jgi:hypothetical protein
VVPVPTVPFQLNVINLLSLSDRDSELLLLLSAMIKHGEINLPTMQKAIGKELSASHL